MRLKIAVVALLAMAAPLRAATYTVTVTQPANGSISPSGEVTMDELEERTFTVTPNAGYIVSDIIVSGISEGPAAGFTFYGIWGNRTLTALMIPAPNTTPETIYVDNQLPANITDGTYSLVDRTGGGTDGNCYKYIVEACKVAGVGDTILIRGGTYNANTGTNASNNDVMWPRSSGTASQPITIMPYNGETVIVGDGSTSWPTDLRSSVSRGVVTLRNVSYIIIDGITFRRTAGWLWGRDCTHITIQNCNFYDSQYSSKGVARFIESSYCTFKNCRFWNSSFDSLVLLCCDHIVVEDCWFKKAVHSLLSIRGSSWCVIRNNFFSNPYYKDGYVEKLTEMFDAKLDTVDPYNPTYIAVPRYNGTQHNLLEDNWYGYGPEYTSDASRPSGIQFSAQKTIIRHNVFSNPILDPPDPNGGVAGGVAIVWRWGGSWTGWVWNSSAGRYLVSGQGHEAGYVWGNRVYNNVFYAYDNSKMTFPANNVADPMPNPPPMKNVENYLDYPFTDRYRMDDNKIVNNVLAGGVIVPHINWGYITTCTGMPVQTFIIGRRAYTTWVNNCFYGIPGGTQNDYLIKDYEDYGNATPKTPAAMNAAWPSLWQGNIQADPDFVDRTTEDFHLRSASSLIDAGAYLTTVTSTAGSGTTFTVADPNFFFDGYNIAGETGDTIKFANGDSARITDVDYVTGSVTVNGSVTWGTNEPVALNYLGSGPDIGAYDYDSGAEPEPEPPSAPTSPSPSTGATRISTSLTISWSASDGATSYDVYFGTVNPPTTKVSAGQPGLSYAVSGLSNNQTYYWEVVAINGDGDSSATSSVWSFTTVVATQNHYLLMRKTP